jgi:secreted PhoX family phosphatase
MSQRPFTRREFFNQSAAAASVGTLAGGFFDALLARGAQAGQARRGQSVGYGSLSPAGDDLALPSGFQYSVVSVEGDPMDDGFPVPKAMDGMAAFPLANGNILLIRNQEDNESPNRLRPRPPGSTSTTDGHPPPHAEHTLRPARLRL